MLPAVQTPSSLAQRAASINAAHASASNAAQSALQYAIQAGDELIAAKAECGHGQFMKWCEDNLTFSHEIRARYIRLAEFQLRLKFDSDMSITAALASIARPALEHTPRRKLSASGKQLQKLRKAWREACPEVRKQFLDGINAKVVS